MTLQDNFLAWETRALLLLSDFLDKCDETWRKVTPYDFRFTFHESEICIDFNHFIFEIISIYVQESYRNSLIFTKSVSSCMFLTLCVCLRNIQELTDFQNAGKVEKK